MSHNFGLREMYACLERQHYKILKYEMNGENQCCPWWVPFEQINPNGKFAPIDCFYPLLKHILYVVFIMHPGMGGHSPLSYSFCMFTFFLQLSTSFPQFIFWHFSKFFSSTKVLSNLFNFLRKQNWLKFIELS